MGVKATFFFFLCMALFSCTKSSELGVMVDGNLKKALEKVCRTNILFGHQSVGENIVGGIQDIVDQCGEVTLNLIDLDGGGPLGSSFFAHKRIGKNESAKSKMEAFEAILKGGLGDKVDIGLLKMCYIDVRGKDDERAIFDIYRAGLTAIRREYPNVNFIHFTLPLTTNENWMKSLVRRILGRETEKNDNIKRNRFNNMLRDAFREEPIFDLAALESTRPDGRRKEFKNDGEIYYSLFEDYSSDGSHLNNYGSKVVAKELILFLGRVIGEYGERPFELAGAIAQGR